VRRTDSQRTDRGAEKEKSKRSTSARQRRRELSDEKEGGQYNLKRKRTIQERGGSYKVHRIQRTGALKEKKQPGNSVRRGWEGDRGNSPEAQGRREDTNSTITERYTKNRPRG